MLREKTKIFRIFAVIFDLSLVMAAFLLVLTAFQSIDLKIFTLNHLSLMLFSGIVWCFFLYQAGAYKSFRTSSFTDSIYIVLKSAFFGLLALSAFFYFLKPASIENNILAMFFIVAALFLCLGRIILVLFFKYVRRQGFNYRTILLVGFNNRTKKFINIIQQNPDWGFKIIGIVDFEKTKLNQEVSGIKVIGLTTDFADILHNNVVDQVIIIVPRLLIEKAADLVAFCETEGIDVSLAADFFDLKFARSIHTEIEGFPLLNFETTSNKFCQLMFKRFFDIIVSTIGLIALLPFFIIIGILIKSTSRGPVFFKQIRSGLNGRIFFVYKFRSMVEGAESKLKELTEHNEMQGPVFKMKNDPRLTPIGKFLRQSSIDELPQLWNVLMGNMSLVGPRPPLPTEVGKYDNWQRRRLSMRPGITCFWQVKGRNKITDFNEWMRLDLEYIDNWSLFLDLKILLMTVSVVLFGIGAK